ncbi:hypothetical protein JHK82_016168 [Glycine max]|nr:hypothetical protein JHK87_016106 [Glycine soja]KAG5032587.1 hypothetical protein JHK85_016569 [Glycine max]KAG5046793.1 hypothetical protein JHK86_016199 [Glycine max]KAG5149287.1 hypothetical protein JHK82_016168 [Glycine max]
MHHTLPSARHEPRFLHAPHMQASSHAPLLWRQLTRHHLGYCIGPNGPPSGDQQHRRALKCMIALHHIIYHNNFILQDQLSVGSKYAIVTNMAIEIVVLDDTIDCVYGQNGRNVVRLRQVHKLE